ncbi:hypothetical protein [Flammeovirga aprica]|uniref:SMI1/KNR4 family protein n=1 Tax=Flammeovirga aprica JL-4 TaxID=694437 RepID=A0A7X9XB06_9BACT|nr:hypothetical protein [Flammeovirga aprica]NME70226.1 hypothetical protein [Flammeovirga aprica JL-4]
MQKINDFRALVKPLFDDFGYNLIPANDLELETFKATLIKYNIPVKVISELGNFYRVSNGIPCLDIDFHDCLSECIFDFWEEEKSLWLGQRDSDTLRWIDNKFCIGTSSEISYSKDYEFQSLYEMLDKVINEFKE